MPEAHIRLEGLEVRAGSRTLVREVSLDLRAGQVVGLVGASGSGKTITARSLLGMVEIRPGVVSAELEITVNRRTLRPYERCLGAGARSRKLAFAGIRGDVVGYLPQDARAALDPMARVGQQVKWSADLRTGARGSDPLPWLERAGFRDPARVARLYPHELSGGMAQRVSIAQALARGSLFLLADEPTTGLDPTVQREILEELSALRDQGIGILLITHDLRILAGVSDSVLVMDQGRIAERTSAAALRDGTLRTPAARRLYDATRRVSPGGLV